MINVIKNNSENSTYTPKTLHGVIKPGFFTAYRADHLDKHPCLWLYIPKFEDEEPRVYCLEETNTFGPGAYYESLKLTNVNQVDVDIIVK